MSDDWPSCPRCGSRVTISGGGQKDCPDCPWEHSPSRGKNQQTGFGDYQ